MSLSERSRRLSRQTLPMIFKMKYRWTIENVYLSLRSFVRKCGNCVDQIQFTVFIWRYEFLRRIKISADLHSKLEDPLQIGLNLCKWYDYFSTRWIISRRRFKNIKKKIPSLIFLISSLLRSRNLSRGPGEEWGEYVRRTLLYRHNDTSQFFMTMKGRLLRSGVALGEGRNVFLHTFKIFCFGSSS